MVIAGLNEIVGHLRTARSEYFDHFVTWSSRGSRAPAATLTKRDAGPASITDSLGRIKPSRESAESQRTPPQQTTADDTTAAPAAPARQSASPPVRPQPRSGRRGRGSNPATPTTKLQVSKREMPWRRSPS